MHGWISYVGRIEMLRWTLVPGAVDRMKSIAVVLRRVLSFKLIVEQNGLKVFGLRLTLRARKEDLERLVRRVGL